MQDRLAIQRARLAALLARLAALRARLAAPRARLGALATTTRGHFGKASLTTFQWIVSGLLGLVAVAVCFGLVGLGNSASELSDGIRENTRVLSTLHADVLKGFAGFEQKITDMNQKLADIAVELDDTLVAQKTPNRAPDTPESKAGGRKTASSRAGRGSRALTVRRGRER